MIDMVLIIEQEGGKIAQEAEELDKNPPDY